MTNNQINSFGTVFISICLKYKKKENKVGNVWSNQMTYNENPHDVKTLYSGILQEKFVDKICREENGEFSIPDIPEELKKCVLEHNLKENSLSSDFKFTILYNIEGSTRKVDAQATGNQCLESRKIDGNGDEGGKLRGTEITIISGSGTVSFICFWARKL